MRGQKPRWWRLARFPRRKGVRGAGVEEVITALCDDDGASRGVGEGFAGKKGATEHYGGWWKKGCKLLVITVSGRANLQHMAFGDTDIHTNDQLIPVLTRCTLVLCKSR